MTAFARLWHRAPIWRAFVCTAAVSAVVGGLFLYGQGMSGGVVTTYHRPQLADLLTKPRIGIAEAFGRQTPLPPGAWYRVISGTESGRPVVHSDMLMRVANGKPDAFISIQSIMTSPSGPQLHVNYRCAEPGELAYATPPVTDDTQFECWSLRRRSLPDGWQAPGENSIYRLSLQRLAEVGAAPSGAFIETNWFLADSGGAILVSYLMPGQAANEQTLTPQQISVMKQSASRWAELLESGAKVNLDLGEIQSVTRLWPTPAGSPP